MKDKQDDERMEDNSLTNPLVLKIIELKDKTRKNEVLKLLHVDAELVEFRKKKTKASITESSQKGSDCITCTDDTCKIFSSSLSLETSSDVTYENSDEFSMRENNNSRELRRKMKRDELSDEFSSEICSSYSSGGTRKIYCDMVSNDSKEEFFKKYSQRYGNPLQETQTHHKKKLRSDFCFEASDKSSSLVSSTSSDKTETSFSLSSDESQKKRDYVLRGSINDKAENEGFFYDFSDGYSSDSQRNRKNHTCNYTIDDLYKKSFQISSQKSLNRCCPILSFGVTFKPLKNATYRLFVCGTILELGNSLFPDDTVGKRVELFSDPDNENRPFFWRTEPVYIESCIPGTTIRYSYYTQVETFVGKNSESQMISESILNSKQLQKSCNASPFRSFILPKVHLRDNCAKKKINEKRHFYILDKEYKRTNVPPQITHFNDIHESSSNSSLSF